MLVPWNSLQSSIRNTWSGPHRAPLEWAGTEGHIDPEGSYTTPSAYEHLDHSLMNTAGRDGEMRGEWGQEGEVMV